MVIKFTSFHCHTLCLVRVMANVDMILNAVLYRMHGAHEVQDFYYSDRYYMVLLIKLYLLIYILAFKSIALA